MPIYALGAVEPSIHADAFVHPDATIIGDVTVGANSSVWPQAVLRGDSNSITVGENTSVQDGSIVHCSPFHATTIGSNCVVGHAVHIEGATIADRCLIASGSVVLNGSVVEQGAIVGAGAVLSYNFELPSRRMALGVPGKVRQDYTVPEDYIDYFIESYVAYAKRYRTELRRID